jgi:hypothetical protein
MPAQSFERQFLTAIKPNKHESSGAIFGAFFIPGSFYYLIALLALKTRLIW